MFEEYAAKTIGIDFGTNNSVVGVYNTKIEKPLVIENEEGLKSPVDIINSPSSTSELEGRVFFRLLVFEGSC